VADEAMADEMQRLRQERDSAWDHSFQAERARATTGAGTEEPADVGPGATTKQEAALDAAGDAGEEPKVREGAQLDVLSHLWDDSRHEQSGTYGCAWPQLRSVGG
jgi:hypothetical protein